MWAPIRVHLSRWPSGGNIPVMRGGGAYGFFGFAEKTICPTRWSGTYLGAVVPLHTRCVQDGPQYLSNKPCVQPELRRLHTPKRVAVWVTVQWGVGGGVAPATTPPGGVYSAAKSRCTPHLLTKRDGSWLIAMSSILVHPRNAENYHGCIF
jgi:hypothetical protein